MRGVFLLSLLVSATAACNGPEVTAAPEPPPPLASSLRVPASAPSPSAAPMPTPAASASAAQSPKPAATPASASADPGQQLDASKKPAPPPAGEVCKGAAREGCVPKNDPFGFVARE